MGQKQEAHAPPFFPMSAAPTLTIYGYQSLGLWLNLRDVRVSSAESSPSHFMVADETLIRPQNRTSLLTTIIL